MISNCILVGFLFESTTAYGCFNLPSSWKISVNITQVYVWCAWLVWRRGGSNVGIDIQNYHRLYVKCKKEGRGVGGGGGFGEIINIFNSVHRLCFPY